MNILKNLMLFSVLAFGASSFAGHDLDSALRELERVDYHIMDISRDLERGYPYDYDVQRAVDDLYQARRFVGNACESLEEARRAAGRIIIVSEVGSGGTTQDDRTAACGRAEERALNAAQDGCYRQGGQVLSHYYSDYQYVRKDSKEKICRVTSNVRCRLR
ncbi:hypothetical protein GW915_08355 [bacterium]|nr:hypothetical protein [bacterium]